MNLAVSTLSSQGQLTVPVAVRRQLGIDPGSVVVWEITMDVLGSPQASLRAATGANLKKLRGAGKKLYQAQGGGARVLDQERDAWD